MSIGNCGRSWKQSTATPGLVKTITTASIGHCSRGCFPELHFELKPIEYTAAGEIKTNLWPGSGLFEKRPKWIVAAELVETSRRYSRVVARIDPDWIEPLAQHLVKKSLF